MADYQIKKNIWSFFLWAAFVLPLPHDGNLRIYNYHDDNFLEIRYLDSAGNWLQSAHDELNKFLSSRDSHELIPIDKRLIELLDHLQDYFQVDTVEVISAYRSPEFNDLLKQSGRDVAENSFHTKGMACDFHLDEIRESTVRDYLRELKLGGVGYYGNLLMVHADFGPVRTWQGGVFSENTEIGIFNEHSALRIRTDRLFYDADSTIKLSGADGLRAPTLQRFYRGSWIENDAVPVSAKFGKFRYYYKSDETWQNSNEFYIKKK